MNPMEEKPILFSGPMVRAILEGRKTQTRRMVKRNASGRVQLDGKQWHIEDPEAFKASPYGQPGDRLWVKETWRTRREWDNIAPLHLPIPADELADPEWCANQYITYATDDEGGVKLHGKLRPSIFMRRWMSRLTLEITAVRVERLQEISGQDAEAEGVEIITSVDHGRTNPAHTYAALWESINGPGSWASNPWVWVVEFKRKEQQ